MAEGLLAEVCAHGEQGSWVSAFRRCAVLLAEMTQIARTASSLRTKGAKVTGPILLAVNSRLFTLDDHGRSR